MFNFKPLSNFFPCASHYVTVKQMGANTINLLRLYFAPSFDYIGFNRLTVDRDMREIDRFAIKELLLIRLYGRVMKLNDKEATQCKVS